MALIASPPPLSASKSGEMAARMLFVDADEVGFGRRGAEAAFLPRREPVLPGAVGGSGGEGVPVRDDPLPLAGLTTPQDDASESYWCNEGCWRWLSRCEGLTWVGPPSSAGSNEPTPPLPRYGDEKAGEEGSTPAWK